MRLTHTQYQRFLVFVKFGKHIFGRNKIRVVVRNPLQARNVANRTDGCSADFANPFGDIRPSSQTTGRRAHPAAGVVLPFVYSGRKLDVPQSRLLAIPLDFPA